MKRFLIFVLAALCLISFAACRVTEGESENEKVEDGTRKSEIAASDAIEIVSENLNIEYDSDNVLCFERDDIWYIKIYHCDGENDLVTFANVDKYGKIISITTKMNTPSDPDDPVVARKPVIYLYPTEETDITVKLDFDGELTYTYPEYKDSWTVTASPDGTLTDESGREYYCLFWEGEANTSYDFSQGFCVKGEDTAAFLEDALTRLGLNEREANEFIIYWLPQMEENKYNLISFQSEAYTDSAELMISPAPDSLLRVFMAWKPAPEAVEIEPQEFEEFDRHGFVAVEWGGARVN